MRVTDPDVGSDSSAAQSSYASSRRSSPASSVADLISSITPAFDVQVTSGEAAKAIALGTISPHQISLHGESSAFPAVQPAQATQAQPDMVSMLAQTRFQEAMIMQLIAAQARQLPPPALSMPMVPDQSLRLFTGARGAPGGSMKSARALLRKAGFPRLRVQQACEKCRKRKVKCTGDRPTCGRCQSKGITCQYASSDRSATPPNSWRDTEENLTSQPVPVPLGSSDEDLAALVHEAQARYLTRTQANTAQLPVPGVGDAMFTSEDLAQVLMRIRGQSHSEHPLAELFHDTLALRADADLAAGLAFNTNGPSMYFPGGPSDSMFPQSAAQAWDMDSFLLPGNSATGPSGSLSPSDSSAPVWPAEPPVVSTSSSTSTSDLSSSSLQASESSSIGSHQGVGIEHLVHNGGRSDAFDWLETLAIDGNEAGENSSLDEALEFQFGSDLVASLSHAAMPTLSNISDISAPLSLPDCSLPPVDNPANSSLGSTDSGSNSSAAANLSTASARETEAQILAALYANDSNTSTEATSSSDSQDLSIESAATSVTSSEESDGYDFGQGTPGDVPPVLPISGTFHDLAFTGSLPSSYFLSSDTQADEVLAPSADEAPTPTIGSHDSESVAMDPSDSSASSESSIRTEDSIFSSADTSIEPTEMLPCTRSSSTTTSSSEPSPKTPTDDGSPMGDVSDYQEKVVNTILGDSQASENSDLIEAAVSATA